MLLKPVPMFLSTECQLQLLSITMNMLTVGRNNGERNNCIFIASEQCVCRSGPANRGSGKRPAITSADVPPPGLLSRAFTSSMAAERNGIQWLSLSL